MEYNLFGFLTNDSYSVRLCCSTNKADHAVPGQQRVVEHGLVVDGDGVEDEVKGLGSGLHGFGVC